MKDLQYLTVLAVSGSKGPGRAFPSVQHDELWPTSIFVRRPSCLELTARTPATNHFNRTFRALSKNVFIRADIALSVLETFLFNGLYKFTLLTYYVGKIFTVGFGILKGVKSGRSEAPSSENVRVLFIWK